MNLHDTVDVWFLDKEKLSTLSYHWEDVISAEEQQRANRFHFIEDKQAFIIYHACKRLILSSYLKISPQDIKIFLQEKGKPFLKNSSLTFNLSHTKDAAILAVTNDTEVGVDLEKIKTSSNYLDIAKRFFHPEEYTQLESVNNEQKQQKLFLLLWTAKEAILKATGEGIAAGLNSFCIQSLTHDEAELKHTYPSNIALSRLVVPDNYVASLAVIGAQKSILYRDKFI